MNIIFPRPMSEILINIDQSFLKNYQKINKSIYYQQENKEFFKLSFLPQGVLFHNNQVSQPSITCFTKYDQRFIALNLLIKSPVLVAQLPKYLTQNQFQLISDKTQINGKQYFSLNRNLAFDFLEKKVESVQKCISQNFDSSGLKLQKGTKEQKYLKDQTILILKSEVENSLFIQDFAKQRFNYSFSRKLMAYGEQFQQNAHKNDQFGYKKQQKSKKQEPKKQERLSAGQKTLGQFFKKKQ